ncbi:DUF2255 family protein [Secundilactobacillus folii]|uniref:DUF2255 family protein n=1 Tax=Secundilactobacillus folii TaxID=2678357 RepID=A0A7X3C2B3_9LACO|nr:DUF2255 family protein [Secundilactobacillus folii]MTV81391.1 DUF2255 family protein [Secundilactobacillus folii]
MTEWTKEQLNGFAEADDFHVSPFREDGKTYGTPTWIWSVVADGNLYIRAYNGTNSRWYQAAKSEKAGRIHLNAQDYEVTFTPVAGDAALTADINQAYNTKYGDSPYLPPMVTDKVISATVKVTPRD